MASQSIDTTLRELKKRQVRPVYYLVGAEDLLKDDVVRMVTDAVLDPTLRDFNLDSRSASSLDPEQVFTLLNTLPMMSDRRVVVLRDVEAWQKRSRGRAELLRYLERPAAETVLLIVQGSNDPDADAELSKHAVTVDCAPLPADRAVKWVLHKAELAGLSVPDDAASHLVEATGGDLGTLNGEIEKLAALPSGTAITRELVGSLVGVRHGETMYDWRDAVFSGEASRALALLGPVLAQSGMSGVKLNNLVGTTLVGISLARAHLDRGVRGSSLERAVFNSLRQARPFGLGNWSAEASNWSRWAQDWPAARVAAGLRAALEIDIAFKSTTLRDEQALLTELILQLHNSRAERAA